MSPRLRLVTNHGTPRISARSWAINAASTISAGYGGHSSSSTSGNITSTTGSSGTVGAGVSTSDRGAGGDTGPLGCTAAEMVIGTPPAGRPEMTVDGHKRSEG